MTKLSPLFCRKHIVILGLGREGSSSYRFLKQHSIDCTFSLADQSPHATLSPEAQAIAASDPGVRWHLGDRYLESLTEADIVIKTAGIPYDGPGLPETRARGVSILSNTSLFFELSSGPTIGVTGTKGKSTTTSCIAHVLNASGTPCRLLGNIGVPPLDTLSDASGAQQVYAVELSSFQLCELSKSPRIAVLQHIAPEHLDFHHTFESYIEAKARIARFQGPGDIFLYNHASETAKAVAMEARSTGSPARQISFGVERPPGDGAWIDGSRIVWCDSREERVLATLEDVPLRGAFNVLNVMPSLIIPRLLDPLNYGDIAPALRSFRPLEHRLEPCGSLNGVEFYNDSLSTVPEATIAAVEALAPAPVVLIAGGHDRGVDYSLLGAAVVQNRIRALILFPPTGHRILEAVSRAARESNRAVPEVHFVETMSDAVSESIARSQTGDAVLMSPASASFGRFVDYRDRGQQFREAVQSLGAASKGSLEGSSR